MSTHNVHFQREIIKIFMSIPLLSEAMINTKLNRARAVIGQVSLPELMLIGHMHSLDKIGYQVNIFIK